MVEPEPAQPRPLVPAQMPVPQRNQRARRRGGSPLLAGLFVLVLFHTLHAARPLFLPMVLAILASCALAPIVRGASRWGVPRSAAATVLVTALIIGGGAGLTALSTPAANWIDRAPATLREVEQKLRPLRAPVERIARATREVQEATEIEERNGDTVLVSEESLFSDLVVQTQGLLSTLLATLVLLLFLLASKDGLGGAVAAVPRWFNRPPIARGVIEAIEMNISRHLLTISLVNAGLGVTIGVALALLGMPNPALWGAMAAILNFIPFLGPFVGTVVVAAVALISFEGTDRAIMVAATFALITSIEGLLVTPTVLGRRLTLSPVAVLVSLLVWTHLWGVPGALIAVPLLAVSRIVWDQVHSQSQSQ